jgi:hypothetical protein
MRARLPVLVVLALIASSAPAAAAPAPDEPADSNPNHVHRRKPWKPRFEYRMLRAANAYAEPNSRADVDAVGTKDGWYRIGCQLENTTQRGRVLWDFVVGLGWVADHHLKTFTDGPLEGAPACSVPFPNHVWYEQAWDSAKEYRLRKTITARTRPGGAETTEGYVGLTWTTIQCADTTHRRPWIRTTVHPTAGELWIPAAALRLWQKGVPAGLPSCVSQTPRRFVVLGDSYAAGVGAGADLDFVNPYEPAGKNCYRSTHAYWGLLAFQLAPGMATSGTDFEACTGDKIRDLYGKLAPLNADTKLVTVSIGGNDLSFSTVVTKCYLPGGTSCPVAIATYINDGSIARLRHDLDVVYTAIRNHAPHALVLVMGYPELVPPDHIDDCGAMDDSDAPLLHEAAVRVNGAIRETVQRHRGFTFVGLAKTFRGHTACNHGSEDWINAYDGGDGRKRSFHPNVPGNAAIAQRIRDVAPRFFE